MRCLRTIGRNHRRHTTFMLHKVRFTLAKGCHQKHITLNLNKEVLDMSDQQTPLEWEKPSIKDLGSVTDITRSGPSNNKKDRGQNGGQS